MATKPIRKAMKKKEAERRKSHAEFYAYKGPKTETAKKHSLPKQMAKKAAKKYTKSIFKGM